MGKRRMISKSIVESARFLKMPATTQNLYFHLCINADDDGIAEAYSIMRITGATEDDLRVIISKGFAVLLNEDFVVYLTDWLEHNSIKPSRKIDSIYKPLLLQILPDVKLQKSTKTMDTCPPYVEQKTDTCCTYVEQIADTCPADVALSKDKLSKDKLSKDKINREGINYQLIADMYNDTCVSFPRVTKLSDARKKAIKARMKQYSIEDFQKLFEMAEQSSFLKGHNNRNWSANFDWLLKDANMAKVLDGNYTDSGSCTGATGEGERDGKYVGVDIGEILRKNGAYDEPNPDAPWQ